VPIALFSHSPPARAGVACPCEWSFSSQSWHGPTPPYAKRKMRRRPGIAGIQQRRDASVAIQAVGEDAERQSVEAMRAQLLKFRNSLEQFALKHKSEIKQDPGFRAQFHAMCANVGVDPLASNKGFWTELLGFGDFYYELGVQVAEACLATRDHDGGLCDMTQLMRHVQHRRGNAAQPISEDDLLRAIERLACLGGGWRVLTIGGKKVVRSVPTELSTDQNDVIRWASESGVGSITKSQLESTKTNGAPGWHKTRAQTILDQLVKSGIAMVDDGDAKTGERVYWLPCVSKRNGG
jgi:ESCRT-II complex subunit VPS22